MNIKKRFKTKYRLLLPTILLMMALPAGCGCKDAAEVPAGTRYSALTKMAGTADGTAAPVSAHTMENTMSPAAPRSESKASAVVEYKFAFREPFEGILLKNHGLQKCIYEQLGKEEGTPLYEEELASYRGALHPTYSFSITNGQELDFVRTYFDLYLFSSFSVTFTPDLHGWSPEQLEGLKDLQSPVSIESSQDTFPAEVLIFFTGTDELTFCNMRDVTGSLPVGRPFPDTVRDVTISSWGDTPCAFENLFACMQDSNVENLSVLSVQTGSGFPFPLDAVSGMRSLVQLHLGGSRIGIKNRECLSESRLQYLTDFVIDGQTDTSVFQLFPQLTGIICSITADADLAFISQNETLALKLHFCPHNVESSRYSSLYPNGEPAIFPALDDALGWRGSEDEDNFLAIYQRLTDEGRTIESFSIRCRNEDYGKNSPYPYPIRDVRVFLRVTDGEHVQLLIPEAGDSEWVGFGDFRSDSVSLVDINFDGINDIIMSAGVFGNSQEAYAFGWIYDTIGKTYQISGSFREIPNPSVDTEHQLVRSIKRYGALSWRWAIYRYDTASGIYRLDRSLIENFVTYEASESMPDLPFPEGELLREWEETIFTEEEEISERHFYYTPVSNPEYSDAYYRFCEPDSYWGSS